jgi:hypothetical protein
MLFRIEKIVHVGTESETTGKPILKNYSEAFPGIERHEGDRCSCTEVLSHEEHDYAPERQCSEKQSYCHLYEIHI